MRVLALLLAGAIGLACGQQVPPMVTDATATVVGDGTMALVAMTITAEDDNDLIGVSVNRSVGRQAVLINPEAHPSDPGHLGHLDPGGGIAPPGHSHAVRLPAGSAIHVGGDGPLITVSRVSASLNPGDRFEMVLSFSKSANVTVSVLVVDPAR
jgi:copper(I)-binding protein